MAEKIYAVLLHVRESQISTVLSALTGSSTLVSVSPTKETAEKPANGFSRFVGGKRNKGITGYDLGSQIFKDLKRVMTTSELANLFAGHGFAKNSISPVLARLVKENKIKKLGGGKYIPAGVSVKLG
jgi:hypothetical protein